MDSDHVTLYHGGDTRHPQMGPGEVKDFWLAQSEELVSSYWLNSLQTAERMG